MRQPKPFWKTSHKCWYVKINGHQRRLDPDEVEAWRIYHQMMAGTRAMRDDDSVILVIDQFLEWSNAHHAESTFRFYLDYNRSFTQSIPRTLKLRDLRPIHVTKWVDRKWPPKANSNNTRRGAIRSVQRAFSWARKQRLIDTNPLEFIEKPKQTPRDVYLWPEQYNELVAHIKDQVFRDFVEVLRHTGCRPQEARIIEAKWVNWENRCWEFPREFSKGGRRRTVLLNDVAFEICRRAAMTNTNGPLLRNSKGGVWKRRAIADRCRRLREKVDFYVCAYAIRHTFATDAILKGVDLMTIKELMGHADLSMLTEIYQHVEKHSDHLRKGLEQATGHLTPISPCDVGPADECPLEPQV